MSNDLDRVHPEQRRLRPAYALWALTGFLGAHRIYLRRPLGFLQGGLFVGGALTAFGVGSIRFDGYFFGPDWAIWTILGGAAAVLVAVLWALVDAFRIPKWIRQHNRSTRRANEP